MVEAVESAPADALASVWRWLEEVVDPEIPVLSVVDLGVVRDVQWRDADHGPVLQVTVTPTYSGCPATEVIVESIRSSLAGHGVARLEIATRIAPPWTTDWISRRGRRKLQRYGIAPPDPLAPGATPPCPRCGAADSECLSRFGSTPCKALYRCRACREPFDHFKCH